MGEAESAEETNQEAARAREVPAGPGEDLHLILSKTGRPWRALGKG